MLCGDTENPVFLRQVIENYKLRVSDFIFEFKQFVGIVAKKGLKCTVDNISVIVTVMPARSKLS